MEVEQPALIFIADDNPNNLKVLFGFLKEAGFRVLVATNGEDALTKLQQISPDLILLDVMMPKMDGFEVCHHLKTNPNFTSIQDVPVIFMTALSEPQDKVKALELGAVDYITKPFYQEEVLARIQLHLKLRLLTKTLQEKNEHLTIEIAAREIAEAQLSQLNQALEVKVAERTQELSAALEALKIREERLSYQASHDSLTGLLNRAWLLEHFSTIMTENQTIYQDYNVLFLDLDDFKNINDRLGHLVGDELLQNLAERLTNFLGDTSYIVRLGGDEFLILIKPQQRKKTIELIAEDLLQTISQHYLCNKYPLTISGSIGILDSIIGYTNPNDIFRDVDIAMYQAKLLGKGTYVILTPEIQAQALERIEIESQLKKALELDEFRLYYQPIVSLENQKLLGFESLIRWQNPKRGLLSPGKFLDIALEIGLLDKIEIWTLHTACKQLQIWQNTYPRNPPLFVNVNFTATQLQRANFAEDVSRIIQEYDLAPSKVKLEVTESAFLEINQATKHPTDCLLGDRILEQISQWNLNFCIDDFGTGYSSFSRLYTLPVSTLKIDRSFVERLDINDGLAIVQTIINLAHNLGLDVVAEGIETLEQMKILQQLGCDFGQGYFFSRPLTAQAATDFITE